jgi:hypothetical protein
MKLDTYSLKARLVPTILLLLPGFLAVAAWMPFHLSSLKSVGTLAFYCGLLFFLTELGRDQGRKKQPALFRRWGGKPTIRLLRHQDTTLDPVTLGRYHAFLSAAIGKRLPSPKEEASDLAAADALYESAGNFLLEATRDEAKFPLLLKENISYGFRRNLWGMKPVAILICLLALFASVIPVGNAIWANAATPLLPLTMAITTIFLLVLWLLRVTPDWVRLAADAYAIRLLAACDQLAGNLTIPQQLSRLVLPT